MDMEERVYQLMERFEKTSLTKLELEIPGLKLNMERKDIEDTAVEEKTKRKSLHKQEEPTIETEQLPVENLVEVKSPLAGTFYRSPSPDAVPFVQKGEQVKKGQIIGIIEAMKLMNEIEAPTDGVLVDIQSENASLVSFGQVLMKIKES